jgi:hypothetical protein
MMEMGKMTERLLAKLEDKMDVNQKKAEADKEDLLTRMETIIDANQKKAEAEKQEMLARMKEDRKANQEDLLARMDAYHEKRMAMFDAYQKRVMACLGQEEADTKKIEQDPGMMQSVEEHQDVPSEDVVLKPVKGLKKRRRGRKLTAR